jgi:hypothetical protein
MFPRFGRFLSFAYASSSVGYKECASHRRPLNVLAEHTSKCNLNSGPYRKSWFLDIPSDQAGTRTNDQALMTKE